MRFNDGRLKQSHHLLGSLGGARRVGCLLITQRAGPCAGTHQITTRHAEHNDRCGFPKAPGETLRAVTTTRKIYNRNDTVAETSKIVVRCHEGAFRKLYIRLDVLQFHGDVAYSGLST